MKKLLFSLLIPLLALPAMSQTHLFVSGIVTDLANGNPIANQAVIIHNDSTSPGYFYHTAYTSASGYYNDTILLIGSTSGNLYVGTVDCQNYMQMQWFTYNPAQTIFTASFAICSNANPCQASYLTAQTAPLTVQFTNTSVGGNNMYQWNFGDGGTSSLSDPLHTYALPGFYNVSLTIGALGTTCYQTISQTIYVTDSTSTGCQASFIMVPDSVNSTNTFHFFDTSTGTGIASWTWNFGDGVIQTITFPSNPSTVHTFSLPGTYTVCLTIQSNDTSCFDVTCQTLTVGGSGGCQAAYTYYSDSLNSGQTVHFIDQSQGTLYAWNWNFGDPASGASNYSTQQNPSHTFTVPGVYSVCLTVYGADSCQDITCQYLTINVLPTCQAAFTYYADSTGLDYTLHFLDQSVGNITNWAWTFGDGTSSTEQNPVHVYAAPGYYFVSLTVSSPNQWCTDAVYDTIYVNGGLPCQASFVYNINPSTGIRTVFFTDQSTGNPTSWLWSFGDGTSSTQQHPTYTFAGSATTFNVCLTIATANSCTSTWCQTITLPDSTAYSQIYGQVFAGSFPLTSGLAVLYSFDTLTPNQPVVEIYPIDSNGVYYFSMVPDGNYYLLAIPFDSGQYLPTYFGNTINWSQATLIVLGTPVNPYNINLVTAGQMMPGNGSVSGQIGQGDFPDATSTDLINMFLMNDQGTPIGFTRVSGAGSFSFPSLAYGTYYLKPELPGVVSDQVMITLNEGQPHAEVVMTYSGNKILGVASRDAVAGSWSVFPNPATDHVSLVMTLTRETMAVAEIFNPAGQVVVSRPLNLHSGIQQVDLPTGHLPAGVYTLRIYAREGIYIHAKLIVR